MNQINSILLPIFDNQTLNGVKYLDYIAFKEAVRTYLDLDLSKSEKLDRIITIKSQLKAQLEADIPVMPEGRAAAFHPD